jgi:hypothetical protein
MAIYLVRKDRFTAIEYDGSNQGDIENWVENLPNVDNYYDQFTGITFTPGPDDLLTISTNESGNVDLYPSDLIVEGNAIGAGLVSNATSHPAFFKVEV